MPIGLVGLFAHGRRGLTLGVLAALGLGLAVFRFVPALPSGAIAVDPAAPRIDVAT